MIATCTFSSPFSWLSVGLAATLVAAADLTCSTSFLLLLAKYCAIPILRFGAFDAAAVDEGSDADAATAETGDGATPLPPPLGSLGTHLRSALM